MDAMPQPPLHTMEAMGNGDQAQQEDQDGGGQRDPDQGAAGTWRAGEDSSSSALGDGVWGGKGRKARQVLRGGVGGHDHHPGVSFRECITPEDIAENLEMSRDNLN